jgi:hypothetical protein
MEKTAHMIQSYLGCPLCKGGLAAICASTDVGRRQKDIFMKADILGRRPASEVDAITKSYGVMLKPVSPGPYFHMK